MYYVGLDAHKKQFAMCVLDAAGKGVSRKVIRGGIPALLRRPFVVVFEASQGAGFLRDALRKVARRVVVANPSRTALIFKSKRKNDRADAESLAKLLILDRDVLRPRPPTGPERVGEPARPHHAPGPVGRSLAADRSGMDGNPPEPAPARAVRATLVWRPATPEDRGRGHGALPGAGDADDAQDRRSVARSVLSRAARRPGRRRARRRRNETTARTGKDENGMHRPDLALSPWPPRAGGNAVTLNEAGPNTVA